MSDGDAASPAADLPGARAGDKARAPAPSRLLAYLQLLRAPNVFTAVADVVMGFVVVQGGLSPPLPLLTLVACSCSLYLAGMVLNDVYDFEVDLRERSQRPLPSGRIARGTAWRLGYGLLVAGIFLGWGVGVLFSDALSTWRSGSIATTLALCVLLYDRALKSTPLGPVAMGTCRGLNVLLGMSWGLASGPLLLGFTRFQLAIAGGVGLYIVGVTVFARSEAEQSRRLPLVFGLALMAAGIGLLGYAPQYESDATSFQLDRDWVWPGTLALLTVTIFRRGLIALVVPNPLRVQAAVKQCILSLIVLDAAVCLLVGPWYAAVGILLLLLPTLVLGRWIYST